MLYAVCTHAESTYSSLEESTVCVYIYVHIYTRICTNIRQDIWYAYQFILKQGKAGPKALSQER